MQTRRWVNPTQPQTLQISIFLLYFTGALTLLFGLSVYVEALFIGPHHIFPESRSALNLLRVALSAVAVAGGYGIANERKWGYAAGLTAAMVPLAARIVVSFQYQVNPIGNDLLQLIFEAALVALLLHPQSRDYQRIWFK